MAKDASIDKEKALRYQLKKLIDDTSRELKRIEEGFLYFASREITRRKLLRFSSKLDKKGRETLELAAEKLLHVYPNDPSLAAAVKELLTKLVRCYKLAKLTPYEPAPPQAKEVPKSHRDLISERMKQASLVHDVKKLARKELTRDRRRSPWK